MNAQLIELKAPYTAEEFDKKLKQQNMTLDDLKLQIRRKLTSDKLINKEIESKINITDADINSYYAKHKSEFNVIEPQYHLAWIVVTTGAIQQAGNLQNNKATSDADARKKIQTVRNRLTTGEDFGALAMNYSDDPNANSTAGDMGFISESALQQRDPATFAAISKLKVGQITDVLPVYGGARTGSTCQWLCHLQTDWARTSRTARTEQSQCAAEYPPGIARKPRAVDADRLHRNAARRCEGAELFCRTDSEAGLEIKDKTAIKLGMERAQPAAARQRQKQILNH